VARFVAHTELLAIVPYRYGAAMVASESARLPPGLVELLSSKSSSVSTSATTPMLQAADCGRCLHGSSVRCQIVWIWISDDDLTVRAIDQESEIKYRGKLFVAASMAGCFRSRCRQSVRQREAGTAFFPSTSPLVCCGILNIKREHGRDSWVAKQCVGVVVSRMQ
jgi:hypothetical protein